MTKKALSPSASASINCDPLLAVPLEIRLMQALEPVHPPTPAGSYSYTSSRSLTSRGDKEAVLSKKQPSIVK